jgi:hypothetical protein
MFSSEDAKDTLLFYQFLYEMITSVWGDQADKIEAACLELACFGPIKTVILSTESTIETVLQ